jgi:hypothetical protein
MVVQVVAFEVPDPPTVESLVLSNLFEIMEPGTHEMRLRAASMVMELFSAGQLQELSKGLSFTDEMEEGE